MKEFDASRGVQLDASFEGHRQGCERCRGFDAGKPATAGAMCLEGAVLYKRDNPEHRSRAHVDRGEHFASKAQVKRLMRYKGD